MIDFNKIYNWGMGDDNAALEILTAINGIIKGLYVLENYGGIDRIGSSLNIPTDHTEFANAVKDLMRCEFHEMAAEFENMRMALFADKLNWNIVEQMLKEHGAGD